MYTNVQHVPHLSKDLVRGGRYFLLQKGRNDKFKLVSGPRLHLDDEHAVHTYQGKKISSKRSGNIQLKMLLPCNGKSYQKSSLNGKGY